MQATWLACQSKLRLDWSDIYALRMQSMSSARLRAAPCPKEAASYFRQGLGSSCLLLNSKIDVVDPVDLGHLLVQHQHWVIQLNVSGHVAAIDPNPVLIAPTRNVRVSGVCDIHVFAAVAQRHLWAIGIC